jgi:DNA-binding winged helix-turn-helix (wHTH) protein
MSGAVAQAQRSNGKDLRSESVQEAPRRSRQRFVFGERGELEVDPSSYQLKRDGELLAIEPKAFDVLVYLIENRDRVVPNQELFAKFWPPHISATVLSHCVVVTRKLLGDDSSRQETIRTVRGRGYRFVADVAEVQRRDSGLYPVPSAPVHAQEGAPENTSAIQADAIVAILRLLPHAVRETIVSELGKHAQ